MLPPLALYAVQVVSRSRAAPGPLVLLSAIASPPSRLNSPTRPWIGSRPRADASPRRFNEEYGLQTIRIPKSQAHPTKLVQSVAMASVAPPKLLPAASAPGVISGGLLSDAQP